MTKGIKAGLSYMAEQLDKLGFLNGDLIRCECTSNSMVAHVRPTPLVLMMCRHRIATSELRMQVDSEGDEQASLRYRQIQFVTIFLREERQTLLQYLAMRDQHELAAAEAAQRRDA